MLLLILFVYYLTIMLSFIFNPKPFLIKSIIVSPITFIYNDNEVVFEDYFNVELISSLFILNSFTNTEAIFINLIHLFLFSGK